MKATCTNIAIHSLARYSSGNVTALSGYQGSGSETKLSSVTITITSAPMRHVVRGESAVAEIKTGAR